ncbi:hypothetical protein DPMN_061026 [Dreissena polymorpha]|uniref:Uncharacterized protein n=1 Tax=Dreissena polymorpha TaxID=45954 RepID=A0A9D4C689_DREPO|nr:hypothetical protein DPMN_061026 [Dreissena polymorpha]
MCATQQKLTGNIIFINTESSSGINITITDITSLITNDSINTSGFRTSTTVISITPSL